MKIRVGIAETAVVQGDAILEAIGLGSCVAVVFYDPALKIGGMAHPLLPSSNGHPVHKAPSKFMDRAVHLLYEEILSRGANPSRIIAKAAGGATIFKLQRIPNIGEQNVEAVQTLLQKLNIPLVAADFGGSHGRTVEFHVATGEMIIRSLRKGIITL